MKFVEHGDYKPIPNCGHCKLTKLTSHRPIDPFHCKICKKLKSASQRAQRIVFGRRRWYDICLKCAPEKNKSLGRI